LGERERTKNKGEEPIGEPDSVELCSSKFR